MEGCQLNQYNEIYSIIYETKEVLYPRVKHP